MIAVQEVGITDGIETFSPIRSLKPERSYQQNSIQHLKSYKEIEDTRLMDEKNGTGLGGT